MIHPDVAFDSVSRERKVCTTLYNGHYLTLHGAYVQPLLHFVETHYHVMDVSQLMIAFFIISLFAASHIVRNCYYFSSFPGTSLAVV